MPALVMPDRVIGATIDAVRSYGTWRRRHEGVAYWLGNDDGETTMVVIVVAPIADTGPGHFRVSAEENARVIRLAHEYGLIVVGQVHSHPGNRTTHSAGDDRDAFMPSEGMYSLIIPNYARRRPPITTWGIHRYENGIFRKLTDEERANQVRVARLKVDLR